MNENVWLCLPDSLLLHILSYLPSQQLLSSCQVCKHWSKVIRDESLWKQLFYKELKIDRSLPLRSTCRSYYKEYQRLKDNIPSQQCQILKEHTDQVLHVSFAHNGSMFATSSKDGTVKVWSAKHPCKVKYNRNMKEMFRWQYTQFSQFNISDTLLLVSGVHFGPNSTSGEIAVFNIYEDFSLQSRVLNKPYDTFGAWLNDQYLLSGNLHYLGQFSSCSALWLNKATQEIDSEEESVVMRLFKFLNVNASTIRNIMVADSITVNDEADFEPGQMFGNHRNREVGNHSNSENDDTGSDDKKTLDENQLETDVSVSDVPEIELDEERGNETSQNKDEENSIGVTIRSPEGQSSTVCSKRDATDVTGSSPPVKTRKSEKIEDACKPESQASVDETGLFTGTTFDDTYFDRVYCRVKMAEMRTKQEFIEDETMKALICGVGAVQPGASQTPQCESRTEQTDSKLDKLAPMKQETDKSDAETSSHRIELTRSFSDHESGDVLRSWGKHFNFSSADSLDDEPSIQYTDSKSVRNSTENLSIESYYSDLEYDDSSSGSNHDDKECKKKKRKISPLRKKLGSRYLIFSMGTLAYTPHQIGIKRIENDKTQTMRGFLGSTRKNIQHVQEALAARYLRQQEDVGEDIPEDVVEGAQPQQALHRDVEFDKVDHVIDIHGHIIGMALSPDNRYLYVNSRSWPKNCIISDPLKPPPISQEIEMHVYDLASMTEVKRHYGHKAYSSNEELIFIFLDVCQLYVASGAEDKHGYLWDRYYGIQLAKLPHTDVVNSVTFNPRDQEMLVTASDDGTLKVWRSKAKMRQMNLDKDTHA
ncbi:F-box/WD repeat-containing protein 5-like [Glandiceps talaboti]